MTSSKSLLPELGRIVFGLAGIALGTIGLFFQNYAAVWQPIENLIDVQDRTVLASTLAFCELAAGIAALWRRTARVGVLVLAVLYSICAFGWIPRVAGNVTLWSVWNGLFEQLALVAAGVAAFAALTPQSSWSTRVIRSACVLFGICCISFAFGHFTAIRETTAFVPAWIPPSQRFWAWATGVFHLLAGIAILARVQDVLASRLLTAMMFGFGALVWAPMLIAKPGEHFMWAGNAINFALMSAAWVVSDRVARRTS
jgi:uncharacterized membrane protein